MKRDSAGLAHGDPNEQKQESERRQEQGHRGGGKLGYRRVETSIRADQDVGQDSGREQRAGEESGAPPSAGVADRAKEKDGERGAPPQKPSPGEPTNVPKNTAKTPAPRAKRFIQGATGSCSQGGAATVSALARTITLWSISVTPCRGFPRD